MIKLGRIRRAISNARSAEMAKKQLFPIIANSLHNVVAVSRLSSTTKMRIDISHLLLLNLRVRNAISVPGTNSSSPQGYPLDEFAPDQILRHAVFLYQTTVSHGSPH